MAIDDLPLELLRARRSVKWRQYPGDVLPAWVAEMDFSLAPPIARALHEAIDRSDTGYRWADEVPEALASFARGLWGWQLDPERVLVLADVMTGIAQSLVHLTAPGDHVVINPPVYPPFFSTVQQVAQRTVRDVPLERAESGYRINLSALERAFADPQVTAFVLCSPHNPTGTVHSPETLQAIVDLSRAHDVLVIADEIHAALTLPGAAHTPYLAIAGDEALAVSCVSASKAWNIPGLKCAQVVGTERTMPVLLEQVPLEATFGIGHFGVLGTLAAYRDGGAWLSEAIAALDARRLQLGEGLAGLADHGVSWVRPEASYLAWVRFERLGDDPAQVILEESRLALNSGVPFGAPGVGHARVNFATSENVLDGVLDAMGAALRGHAS